MYTRRFFSSLPWFVDHLPPSAPRLLRPQPPPVPNDAPTVLKNLREDLILIPHLEPTSVIVSRPVTPLSAPPLPHRSAQGRRRRGGTYAGESAYEDDTNGLWSWVMLAQVKEGTENRGGIESVVRVVRKSLLSRDPSISLPPNDKRRLHNGWAMVDAGDFAVHILSREAKERYFGHWT
ncbi:hypothetical protein F5887DRAFT_940793 [Amanita rubescens]|nr:hypothetical protein F5887DRAFT_940793 [Amanita rubescens]